MASREDLPKDPNREHREDDLVAQSVYEPPRYTGQPVGPGRYFLLEAPLGIKVGLVWTNDADGLGFRPLATERAALITPRIVHAFQQAAAVGTPATVVFDHWAGQVSQGLAAGPVMVGDLEQALASLNA